MPRGGGGGVAGGGQEWFSKAAPSSCWGKKWLEVNSGGYKPVEEPLGADKAVGGYLQGFGG